MNTRTRLCILLLLSLALIAACSAQAASTKRGCVPGPAIDPRADQMLREMSDYMSGLEQFSVHADTTMEMITPSAMALDANRELDVSVQRPDHIRVDSRVPDHDRQIVYDGQSVTIYSPRHNYYTVIPVTGTIAQTIAALRTKGVEMPLADLLHERPYDVVKKRARHGYYIGESLVDGILCRQLAFRGGDMDWQIWIEKGATPLPRRIVIIDRMLPDAPRHTVTLTKWNVSPAFSADTFTFVPPEGAKKVSFVPSAGRSRSK
jgi:hypothetical protein